MRIKLRTPDEIYMTGDSSDCDDLYDSVEASINRLTKKFPPLVALGCSTCQWQYAHNAPPESGMYVLCIYPATIIVAFYEKSSKLWMAPDEIDDGSLLLFYHKINNVVDELFNPNSPLHEGLAEMGIQLKGKDYDENYYA